MPRKRNNDPDQLSLSFEERLDAFCEAASCLHEEAAMLPEAKTAGDGRETELELRIEIAAACKRAIRESGLSREQVADRVNRIFGRTSPALDIDLEPEAAKRPISIHMLNNYLSKPNEYVIQPALLQAICRVTGSLEPLDPLVGPLGARVISAEESTALLVGKLDSQIRESQRIKRQLSRQIAARKAE